MREEEGGVAQSNGAKQGEGEGAWREDRKGWENGRGAEGRGGGRGEREDRCSGVHCMPSLQHRMRRTELREHSGRWSIPIIRVTACASTELLDQCMVD